MLSAKRTDDRRADHRSIWLAARSLLASRLDEEAPDLSGDGADGLDVEGFEATMVARTVFGERDAPNSMFHVPHRVLAEAEAVAELALHLQLEHERRNLVDVFCVENHTAWQLVVGGARSDAEGCWLR